MSILPNLADRVRCPECDGCGHDIYRMAPDGGAERCPACDGCGSVPLSDIAEREEWASGLSIIDEFAADPDWTAEAEAALENMDF